MSFFNEINDVKLDLREFEEIPLSKHEQKRILREFKRKSSHRSHEKKWLKVGGAVIVVCIVGLTLTMNRGTIASIPFVGQTIEKYIDSNEDFDYSSYKTSIGETAENALGKLTLNEIMMDDRQLFLSATFEPAEHVDFNYQSYITPKIKINGVDYSEEVGAQSIELNSAMFTIYNEVTLNREVDTEKVQIEVSYDTLDSNSHNEAIKQPWSFNIEASQGQLMEKKKIFEKNEVVTLKNGDTVTLQKVVSTPISTTVYYDLTQSTREDIYFNIQSEEGKLEIFSSAFTSNESGDISFTRFNGLELKELDYYLVAYDFEDNQLTESPIPIN